MIPSIWTINLSEHPLLACTQQSLPGEHCLRSSYSEKNHCHTLPIKLDRHAAVRANGQVPLEFETNPEENNETRTPSLYRQAT